MNLFDHLVNEALTYKPDLVPLRMVVEKELLHHDILRELSHAGLLSQLTFIGGTCLRTCYGSARLSEDLDFTGGEAFSRESLSTITQVLMDSFKIKYGLSVEVTEPIREIENVDTWKLKIQTRPARKDQPAQRINIDVCTIPSYQPRPMMLINPYGIEMGTSGLILQVESREEILADKLVAFALRPNRMKYRDLWDIVWLYQQGIQLEANLVLLKIHDHQQVLKHFLSLFDSREQLLKQDPKIAVEFQREMHRFLSTKAIQVLESPDFWNFMTNLIHDLGRQIRLA